MQALLLGGYSPHELSENATDELLRHTYQHLVLRLASIVQMHSNCHHSSCTKGSQRTGFRNQCRFGMPADICYATELVTGSARIETKRSASNIYLNAFNTAMLLALKSNHDLQLLLGTGGCIALLLFQNFFRSESAAKG